MRLQRKMVDWPMLVIGRLLYLSFDATESRMSNPFIRQCRHSRAYAWLRVNVHVQTSSTTFLPWLANVLEGTDSSHQLFDRQHLQHTLLRMGQLHNTSMAAAVNKITKPLVRPFGHGGFEKFVQVYKVENELGVSFLLTFSPSVRAHPILLLVSSNILSVSTPSIFLWR
jgi:hypothetical protein